jgi:hypothetical protein
MVLNKVQPANVIGKKLPRSVQVRKQHSLDCGEDGLLHSCGCGTSFSRRNACLAQVLLKGLTSSCQ